MVPRRVDGHANVTDRLPGARPVSDEDEVRWVAFGETWSEWDDSIFDDKREAMSVVHDEMLDAGARPDDIRIDSQNRHGEDTTVMGYPLHDDIL